MSPRATTPEDPKGLIREAYRIEGITAAECRSIFFDWALSLPEATNATEAIRGLITQYGQPDHPMTDVLAEGLSPSPPKRRRRGT